MTETPSFKGEEPVRKEGAPEHGEHPRLQAIQELGTPAPPPRPEGGIHCLPIIGQVEGHMLLPPKAKTTKYEHIIPQLVAVEQNPNIKGLLVLLNTVGGDIEAGLAIAEMIRTLSKPKVSLILGGGHSIGGPIAVAADRSFIAGTASVTIHPIRLTGLVIGVPQTYEYLDKMQDRVVRFIVENSHIGEMRLRELMFRTGELVRDVGTVLIGADAVRVGLIDEIGGLAEAFQYLRRLIEERERRSNPSQPAWTQSAPAPGPGSDPRAHPSTFPPPAAPWPAPPSPQTPPAAPWPGSPSPQMPPPHAQPYVQRMTPQIAPGPITLPDPDGPSTYGAGMRG